LATSSTKLWAIATFGIAPCPVSLTVSFSPGLAVIAVTLYFIAGSQLKGYPRLLAKPATTNQVLTALQEGPPTGDAGVGIRSAIPLRGAASLNVTPDDGSGVAQRLREARRASGLTQQQVADKLNVSRRAVSEWETGIRLPHVALPALAALYGTTSSFLLYGVEPASAELHALRDQVILIVDEVQTLSRSVQENQDRLAALAETTASSFAETLALLERLILRADEDQPEPL